MGTVAAKATDASGNAATASVAYTVQTVNEFSDFAVQSSGYYLPTGSLLGAGADLTVYRMKANTSTKVATTTAGQTNPYRLMRVGGLDQTKAATVDVGGFTLAATQQDTTPYYGGLRLGWGSGSKLHGLKISGIPGYASGPPGETFALELFHSDAATLTGLTIDGRDPVSGAGVSATLVGYNFTTGETVVESMVAQYAAYGFGVAMWQCQGHQVFNNCDLRFNRSIINIEQDHGGTYDFNACNFGTPTSAKWHAQVSSITNSAVVNFHAPVTGGGPLVVRTYPSETGTMQKDSDLHCYDAAGNDVTADPTKFRITHNDLGT